jgi:gluconate:H+ symporter, GntP family
MPSYRSLAGVLALAALCLAGALFAQTPDTNLPQLPAAPVASDAATKPVVSSSETTPLNATDTPASSLATAAKATETTPTSAPTSTGPSPWRAVGLVIFGVVSVLVMMIALKFHAFVALILSSIFISLLIGGAGAEPIQRVAREFGASAGGIGIVIGMAAVIGKCMLDSGAADRIVQWMLGVLGAKRASLALLSSAYLLAIPVFFDTVFYLLVPLARSLHRKTAKNYLQYLMAVGAGGAVTHTLVPPTPGPLFVANNLDINMGTMILMGLLVAIPSAAIGLLYAWWADKTGPVPMRPVGGVVRTDEELPTKLPSLFMSLLPVMLPVVLISLSTVLTLLADNERRALLTSADIKDWSVLQTTLQNELSGADNSVFKSLHSQAIVDPKSIDDFISTPDSEPNRQALLAAINNALRNKQFFKPESVPLLKLRSVDGKPLAPPGLRSKSIEVERYSRVVLESAYPNLIVEHQWNSTMRQWSDWMSLPGDPNVALILAALASLWVLWKSQGKTLVQLSAAMEESLLSAGVIILITAAGGAFGKMLQETQIADAIKQILQGSSGSDVALSGTALLFLAWGISAFLKVAQGSSTVAMIVASGMMVALMSRGQLPYHPVYIAMAVGTGSLMGSWMNDSGFWVYAKMGGLTEAEALRSWTVMLALLSVGGLLFTWILSVVMPLTA